MTPNALVNRIRRHPVYVYHRQRFFSDPATYVLSFIVQRIFRVNGRTPWPVHYTSMVRNPQNIRLGKNAERCFISSMGCYFQGYNGIFIGENVLFGPGVKLISGNHDYRGSDMEVLVKAEPIRIGSHCWIGAGAIILTGVELGESVVVGAGAVVTRSFPAGVVIGGVPARIIVDP